MRILWLSNMAPGPVQEQLGKKPGGGLWMDHVLEDLQMQEGLEIRMLCPSDSFREGTVGERISFAMFPRVRPEQVSETQRQWFSRQLEQFRPDVIHIWGTEFGHSLAMLQACEEKKLLDRTVLGIQGLCGYVGRHFLEGLPMSVCRRYTLRDFLRQDNLLHQQKIFLKRGENERRAIELSRHLIGRTHWDRTCTRQINPGAQYHFCNETLRRFFYEGAWQYEACEKHRIFASSKLYPIKGFHYVLEAFAQIRKDYPDAVLAVPGSSPCCSGKARLLQDSYARYLAWQLADYGIQDAVQFLGHLDEAQMRREYLRANAFVMPSTIENSSNSLGEAMLLGVPCAASYVGGVPTLLKPEEGILYQGTAPYMLAEAVEQIFRMEKQAEEMGRRAADHAARTHDAKKNLQALLKIYDEIAGEGKPV